MTSRAGPEARRKLSKGNIKLQHVKSLQHVHQGQLHKFHKHSTFTTAKKTSSNSTLNCTLKLPTSLPPLPCQHKQARKGLFKVCSCYIYTCTCVRHGRRGAPGQVAGWETGRRAVADRQGSKQQEDREQQMLSSTSIKYAAICCDCEAKKKKKSK